MLKMYESYFIIQKWNNFYFEINVNYEAVCCCSITQSCLTLQPQELQQVRPPCP